MNVNVTPIATTPRTSQYSTPEDLAISALTKPLYDIVDKRIKEIEYQARKYERALDSVLQVLSSIAANCHSYLVMCQAKGYDHMKLTAEVRDHLSLETLESVSELVEFYLQDRDYALPSIEDLLRAQLNEVKALLLADLDSDVMIDTALQVLEKPIPQTLADFLSKNNPTI